MDDYISRKTFIEQKRKLALQVTHILRNCPEYGLADGYCILSLGSVKDWRLV